MYKMDKIYSAVIMTKYISEGGNKDKGVKEYFASVSMSKKYNKTKGKNMKKKICLFMGIMLLVSSIASGCGKKGSGEGGSDKDTQSGDKTKITMAVWTSGASSRYEKIAENFNKTNDDIEFQVEMQSGDYNQYLGNKKVAEDLPDLFYLGSYTQLREFASSGTLADVSSLPFADKIYEQAKDAVTYDGKLYGFPEMYEYWGIIYNYSLFDKAGISETPKTFDELEEACKKLESVGITPFAAMFKDAWTIGQEFCALQGGAIDNGDSESISQWIESVNSGEGSFRVDGTDRVFEFFDLMKKYSGNNYMDADASTGYDMLANENAAMCFLSDAALIGVSNVTTELDLGYFALPLTDDPEDPQMVGGPTNAIVVNENSENKEAAMEVLEWISSGEEDTWLSIAEGYYGAPLACMDYAVSEEVSGKRYYNELMEYVENGKVRSTLFNELLSGAADEIGNTVQGYIADMKDKDTTLDELDQRFEEMASNQ